MTYTELAVIGVAVSAAVDLLVTRTKLLRRKAFWTAYAILLVFQLLANGVLTGVGVVRYRRSAILGPRLGYAPIEDIAFGFALILLTLSCWVWLGRRSAGPP